MATRRARAGATAALILFGLVVGLATAEVVLRVMLARAQSRPGSLSVGDPVLHHRWRPNARKRIAGVEYTTNGFGLRGPPVAEPKPAGVFRILVLGDSYTEGYRLPFEASVTQQKERMLNAGACRGRFEVVNGGVATYSPILEYLLLKHVGLGLHPDLVILNFDMGDVHDDFIRTRIARLDEQGLPIAVPPNAVVEGALGMLPWEKPRALAFLSPLETLAAHSAVFQALHTLTTEHDALGKPRLTRERLDALGLTGNIQYDPMAFTRDEESPSVREAFALTARYLAATHELARAHGVGFALVVYPYPHQVSAAESPGARAKLGLRPRLYASERPFQVLERLGRDHGFPTTTTARRGAPASPPRASSPPCGRATSCPRVAEPRLSSRACDLTRPEACACPLAGGAVRPGPLPAMTPVIPQSGRAPSVALPLQYTPRGEDLLDEVLGRVELG
ncbi:MAG: SGNH/GDSL hydrolase family protein [Candidatus Rokubacteria bacterium]|nr:SGNH/GDSL hydrolase family protein [Candidatus Rokubacteria bacterium]